MKCDILRCDNVATVQQWKEFGDAMISVWTCDEHANHVKEASK